MRFFEDEAGVTAESAAVHTHTMDRNVYRPVQVAMTGTATVTIRGRLTPDLPWAPLLEFTESGVGSVAVLRELSAEIADNTGEVSVVVDLD